MANNNYSKQLKRSQLLRYVGGSVKNQEKAIEIMLAHFKDTGLTEELLRSNDEKYSLKNMLFMVESYFGKLYGFPCSGINLDNRYQRSIGSLAYPADEKTSLIHIDELLESALMNFFLLVFKWTKEFENLDTYGNCFAYILYILNEECILGDIPSDQAIEDILQILNGDAQILNLASSCYWSVIIFNIAHEVAHSYFRSIGRRIPDSRETKQRRKEEFDADVVAYNIFMEIIKDQNKLNESERMIEPYTILAPMMYMLFFDLFYYTDRVLYNEKITTDSHPLPKRRVNCLFSALYRIKDKMDDEDDLDFKEAYRLFDGFLDASDAFRTELLLKKERGKLEKVTRYSERIQRNEELNSERTKTDSSLIREKLVLFSRENNLELEFANKIVDSFLDIVISEPMSAMISLSGNPASYKIENIRLDLGNALFALADYFTAVGFPDTYLKYVQLIILTVLFVGRATKKEISYDCAVIISILHDWKAYDIGYTVDQIKNEINKKKEDGYFEEFEMEKMGRRINLLLKQNMIRIEDEKIYLNEKVWGRLSKDF